MLISMHPKYALKASFKEALQKGDHLSQSLLKTIVSGSTNADLGAQAQSLMLSRGLLSEIIHELSLQSEVENSE